MVLSVDSLQFSAPCWPFSHNGEDLDCNLQFAASLSVKAWWNGRTCLIQVDIKQGCKIKEMKKLKIMPTKCLEYSF